MYFKIKDNHLFPIMDSYWLFLLEITSIMIIFKQTGDNKHQNIEISV